jgi:hypothetical protein
MTEESASNSLIPRSTVEEIVSYRNRALELYEEAFSAIAAADGAIKRAHAMAERAAGDANSHIGSGALEVKEFYKAVQLPDQMLYRHVAKRLTDLRVWSWVVQRTDLEKLMDAEAKEKLRRQMRYEPLPTRYNSDLRRHEPITGDEVDAGMPPVTVENIYATIQQFALDAESIFRRGIANAFSKLDRRFRSHDGFKIGSRVILTHAFCGSSGVLEYGAKRDTLLDIERTFAVIENGGHLGAYYGAGLQALDNDRHRSYEAHQSCTETRYFRIRGYKNGNAHLWFTRDDLVEKVNKLLAEWYGEVIGDGQTREPDIFEGGEFRLPAKRFGFYPTPDAAAAELLSKISLYRDKSAAPLTILEPSAGTGNLARRLTAERTDYEDIRRREGKHQYRALVDCVEIQPELATALREEGIYRKVHTCDFLQMRPDQNRLYDRVVMNPPFDLERDIDHVVHALKFLKPDGQLHAIMSAGTEFRETKKAKAFRDLMSEMHASWRDLPAGSFSEAGTNVNTVIVRISKDGKRSWW